MIYNVKNRSTSMVVYRIPELNIRREFAPGETKKIDFDELEKLTYQPGGKCLMANFLQIQSESAVKELGIKTEIEYNLSEEQIANLIKEGSLDEFLDCLDFAPVGVIDIIKRLAIALPMEDLKKRKALKEKTGFDVATALRHIEEEKAEDLEGKQPESAPTRRVVQQESTGRRVVKKAETTEEK